MRALYDISSLVKAIQRLLLSRGFPLPFLFFLREGKEGKEKKKAIAAKYIYSNPPTRH